MANVPEAIYQRPGDYDLEHVGDTDDVKFFVDLVAGFKPKRVLELACGNGRVTLPLTESAAKIGFDVVGLELMQEMLDHANQKSKTMRPEDREHLELVQGDMRTWQANQPFDVIITPCSSVCHLLEIDDQIATWRRAYDNLIPGGRFVVDVTMPDLSSYVDSFRTPPREIMEIDLDTFDEATQTRMLRCKTTRYLADKQRAHIRFFYDKYLGDTQPEHALSDFESHVYYPREMELLFRHTGFEIEKVYGDYHGRPLKPVSPQMIFCGVKPR